MQRLQATALTSVVSKAIPCRQIMDFQPKSEAVGTENETQRRFAPCATKMQLSRSPTNLRTIRPSPATIAVKCVMQIRKLGGAMIQVGDSKRLYGMQRAAGSLALAILYTILSGLWSGSIWAQRTRTEFNSPVRQEIQRSQPGSPVTPIALPVTNPSSALGSALASCETGAETSDLSLPGSRGEIKLDRCYRGRDHLVCQFNVLMGEAKSLLENSRKIVDANYPEARDVAGICAIRSETLASDLQNALEFADRFKAVKAEYEARANCTVRIEQSINDAALNDMTQADSLRTSMVDAIEGDVKDVSEIQSKLSQIAAIIGSSQKAMVTLQKIHRAMCMGHDRTEAKGMPSQ